jgi:hypothetical protein
VDPYETLASCPRCEAARGEACFTKEGVALTGTHSERRKESAKLARYLETGHYA